MSEKLSVKRLREILGATVGADLAKEGFRIDTRLTWLTKKVNKRNRIKIFFDCYNYAPTRLEFKLILIFTIHEIKEEFEKFYRYRNQPFTSGWAMVFGEGEFHPKVKHLEKKFRSAATHIVADFEMIDDGIEDCRNVLKNEIIPVFPQFSILEEFQNFVLNDYEAIIRLGLVNQSIIAAKLKGKEELMKLVDFLWVRLGLDTYNEQNIQLQFIEKIIKYAEG